MSKDFAIIVTPQAQRHLQHIRDYIAYELKARENAKNTLDFLVSEMKKLSYMPHRISVVKEEPWMQREIRRLRAKNFYIYFLINEEQRKVYILAVIYVKREQTRQLSWMHIPT